MPVSSDMGRGRRGRSASPHPGVVEGRPTSPSRSPLPHQRAAITRSRVIPAERSESRVVMFPPDWQCPTPGCMSHVKTVFAKKDKCPICRASRPSSFTRTRGSERMSGSDFRRFHPGSSEVSHRREAWDDRDYIWCGRWLVFMDVGPPLQVSGRSFGKPCQISWA